MKQIDSVNTSYGFLRTLSGLKSRIHTCLPVLAMLIMLMVGVGNAWGNSATNDGNGACSNGNIVVGGNHATFTFDPASGSFSGQAVVYPYWDLGYYFIKVGKNSTNNVTLTWSCNGGQSIKVTAVSFKVKLASGGKAVFNGTTKTYSSSWGADNNPTLSASNNEGLTSGMTLALTNTKNGRWDGDVEFQIDDISFTYTITPNKPGLTTTSKTVNVTLPANTANPTTVNYKVFTTADHFGSYWNYAFSSNPNNKGVMSGDNFYATEAGTYKIHAKINALDKCHTESEWSDDLTITVNRLDPTLTYTNGTVDVSVNTSTDKTTLDLSTLKTAYTGNGNISYAFTDGKDHTNGTISGSTFYATEADKTYYITATSTQTGQYAGKTANFTVTVNKRTPTIVFAMTGEDDHIYSGNTLDNMAKVQYNSTDVSSEQVGFWYWFDNPSWFSKNPNDTMQILVSTNYYEETKATLHVTTKETSFYKSVTASHEYDLEVKKTPEFYLNGVLLDQTKTTDLNLEIDSTATFTFDKITSGFQYPDNTKTTHFTYNNETGVLTATVAGDEPFFFNEPGDAVTFQHKCDLHLYVTKHTTELSTILKDNDVWMVDSAVVESALYELVKGDANVQVNVTSDNTAVINKVDGKWKAVGAGTAHITISQAESDKWSGASITRTIKVNRYDPVFDWTGVRDTLNFNTMYINPVASSFTGNPVTYESNKAAVVVVNDTILRTAETADNAVTITAKQVGNYKYNDLSETKTVKVLKLRNHVEVNVTSSESYSAVFGGKRGEVVWDGNNGIRLGGSKTGVTDAPAWNWDDKYVDIKFEGIPKTVSFTTDVTSGAATATVVNTWPFSGTGNTNGFWYMVEHTKNGSWSSSNLWTDNNNNNPGSITKDLKPSTDMIRICYTGNFAGYVKNLKITERTELSIDNNVESLDFGSTDAGSNATKKNFTFDWYNLNPLTLSIEGGDGKYSVSPSSISSKKDSFALNEPVEVSYIHTAGGTHNATLVISEGTTELKRIPLTGTTNKVTPAIIWKENLSPMSRGENVTDPATSLVTLVYTSSDSTVVDVEGNVLKPLKKGTATITASYDGSASPIYNSNSSTKDVLVTNLAVQHIHWTQTFTRLKWSDDEVLSEKNTPDFDFDATVSYYDPETEQEVEITDRAISYTSGNEAVVKVLEGNKLHVVGQGNTTLTAHINGITDSLYEATVVRDVIVREPTLDCEKWVWATDKEGSIRTINSVEYDLNGVEADSIFFDAWREPITVVIEYTDGDLYLAEVDANDHESLLWHAKTQKNHPTNYRLPLKRETKKVKFYTQVGATGYHNFSGVNARVARYLELENTKNKKTHSIYFSTEDAKPGVAKTKTFTVNYSNITDVLDIDLKHGDKFSIVGKDTIGAECGNSGKKTVTVQFLSDEVDNYKDTLLVHNLTDTVYVYLSADVDRNHQQITWNPETTNLKTTDNVTFNATTSASAAGLTISYAVTAGSNVASVDAATGVLTIIKDGDVTIEARCEGNSKYYDANPVPYTFHIEKVTPTITTAPSATGVTLPATLAASNLSGGEASVGGTFAWTNPSTTLVAEDVAYEVTFTPENGNWFNTTTCMVAPQVSKATQTIDWSFNATEMYGNADYTFDATASSGLTVTYSSSKNEVASVNDQNKLVLHKAGESVTITATQAGNEIYLPASEERTFTVLRWTPSIEEYPVGGTMYVGRILSDASLDGGRAEVGGQKVEGSFVWENANSATIDVPGPATHNVIFVPQNGNFYNEVNCGPIGLTVLKYLPVITSNTLTADGIEFPQTLENSNLHGSVSTMDYVHIPNVAVAGHVEWKTPTTILRPGMQTGIALFVPDNSDWYTSVEIPVSVQVTGGYVFNGDNTDWTEADNWAGNLVPTGIDDPVLINENVNITTSVTVGSLTIKEGVDLVVKNGGVLTIGNSDSENRTTYGNLHVENGGQVILGEGKVKVNDFTLDAQLGNISTASASGQVNGAEKLDVNGDAYFQLALDPSGRISYGWYDFVVPFEVEVIGGISVAEIPDMQMKFNVNYAVMDYTEAKRAVNGKYWNKFSGTLIPGRAYTITLDDVYDWNTVVFKKKKGSSVVGSSDFTTDYSGLGADNRDNGWNGFGNGTLHHTELDVDDETLIQLYDHSNKCYQSRLAKDQTIAVGVSFFMQVPEVQTITLEPAVGNTSFLAPSRDRHVSDKFRLALTNEGTEQADDYMWVSADAEATGEYVIGRDVLKMGTMNESKVARMWSERNGMNLCSNEMTLSNSTATCPLNIYAPNEGQYTISVEAAPKDAMLYLTYNGRAIWNLTYSPYVMDLTKGTTEGYGLKMYVQEVTTDIEGTESFDHSVRKVLIDDVIYIITPEGKMYDITGKSVNY